MKELYIGALNAAFGIEGPEYMEEGEFIPLECHNETWYFQEGHTINNGRPTSELQKQRAKEHCHTLDNRGGKNGRAKTWQITYKDGRVIVIKALTTWARENGYSSAGVKNLAYGKWRYYRDIKEIMLLTSKLPH